MGCDILSLHVRFCSTVTPKFYEKIILSHICAHFPAAHCRRVASNCKYGLLWAGSWIDLWWWGSRWLFTLFTDDDANMPVSFQWKWRKKKAEKNGQRNEQRKKKNTSKQRSEAACTYNIKTHNQVSCVTTKEAFFLFGWATIAERIVCCKFYKTGPPQPHPPAACP